MESDNKLDKVSLLLQGKGKKLMLYHTDVDGICSAVLISKFFSGFEMVPRDGPVMGDKFVKALTAVKPDLILALDIPIDQEWRRMEKLQQDSPKTRMLVIDHHVPEKNLGSDRNIHVNPRFVRSIYIPASVLVYRMLEKMGKDVGPLIWIATLGVIGDYAFEDCKDVLDECKRVYPKVGDDPRASSLADITSMMMSAVVLHGIRGVEKNVEILLHADSYASVAENSYLKGCDEKVSGEIKRCMSDFKKKAKEYPELGLFIYKLKSRLNIASTISTMLAEKHPDKIILVVKDSKQVMKISARYQAGLIELNSLMKAAVAGIGSGGGHEKAAGAIVGKKHFPEFERRLIDNIKQKKDLGT